MFFSSPLNIKFFDPKRTTKGKIHISTAETPCENGPAPKIAISPHGLSYTDSCFSTSPGRYQSYTRTFKFNGTVIDHSDPLYPLLACAKFCRKCHTSETSHWRADGNGNYRCNRCNLRQRLIDSKNGGKLRNYKRGQPLELKTFACQICAARVAQNPGKRRDQYMALILCDPCTNSWEQHKEVRPLKRNRRGKAPVPAISSRKSRQNSPTDDYPTPADLAPLPPLRLGTPPPIWDADLGTLWRYLTI